VMSFQVLGGPSIAGAGGGTCQPGSGGSGGGVSDKVAPTQKLTYAPVQDIDKLSVKVRTSETATVRVTATVNISGASKLYRFKPVSRSLAAQASTRIQLSLAKKVLRRAKRALKKHKRLKAKLSVTATDAAGNRALSKATIRLKN
jgi:hypothetical protein